MFHLNSALTTHFIQRHQHLFYFHTTDEILDLGRRILIHVSSPHTIEGLLLTCAAVH